MFFGTNPGKYLRENELNFTIKLYESVLQDFRVNKTISHENKL